MTWLVLTALLGCRPENAYEGIAVGNPGTVKTRIAPAEGLTFLGAYVWAELRLEGCDGSARVLGEHVGLDLIAGTSIEVPDGRWCALSAVPADLVTVIAASEAGGIAQIYLDISTIEVRSEEGFAIDDSALLMEFSSPDWVTDTDLGIEDGDEVIFKEETDAALHGTLVARFEAESTLLEDVDLDGEVSGEDEQLSD